MIVIVGDCVEEYLRDTRWIMERFSAFQSALCTKLEVNVSVNKLFLYLYQLPVYDYSNPETISLGYLPQDTRDKLSKAKSIEEIFIVLSNCDLFSYLKYDIYQSIFQKFCCDSTNEDLKYDNHFQNFLNKRTVKEVIEISPKLPKNLTEESSKVTIKLDVDHIKNLTNIGNLKACISKALDISSSDVRVVTIEEGCVKMTLSIPTHVTKVLFHCGTTFTARQIKGFKDLSIKWLHCSGLIFDAKNNYLLPVTKPDNIDSRICDDHINKIAHIFFNNWKKLYSHLGMEVKDIEVIEAEPKSSDKAVILWKQRKGKDATYRHLIDALIKIECREDAETVCEIFKSQKESTSHADSESGTMSAGMDPYISYTTIMTPEALGVYYNQKYGYNQ